LGPRYRHISGDLLTDLDFRISTGLKDIIGRELITDDRIAIFELVKNSYDADATNVAIEFQNVTSKDPRDQKILIIDDGEGMSYEDIVGKYLFVGFSEKKLDRDSSRSDYRDKITKRKRIFAGAKGIGRFSADRLGSRLRTYTRKEGEDKIHVLDIDWTRFENNQNKQFQTIKVGYSIVKQLPFDDQYARGLKKGTVLEITSLNDSWDRDKLVRLKRYLQRLVNPSPQPERDKFQIVLTAQEFLVSDKGKDDYERINGPIKNEVFAKLDTRTTKVECLVRRDKIFTKLTDKGRFVFSLEEETPYPDLHDLSVTTFFLNRTAKTLFHQIMGIEPKSFGSIFLYKNGFRIHPYGDENNDWLGLDRRKTQGYARFLGNREVIGRIEVYGVQPEFQEVSSRDGGVVDSAAFRQIVGPDGLFISKILKRLEQYVVEAISWDTENERLQHTPEEVKIASIGLIEKIVGSVKDPEKTIQFNKDLLSILKERQTENFPELVRNVEHISSFMKPGPERNYVEKQVLAFKSVARELAKERKSRDLELKVKSRESLFLQKAISSDRDTVINLIHTIENSTLAVENLIMDLNLLARNGGPVGKMLPVIDEISIENQKIKKVASIVGFANFNLRVERITKDIVLYIKEYLETIPDLPGRVRYVFQNPQLSFITVFSPLEVSIMLDNFIGNAKKAGATSMTLRFELRNKKLHLYVADNGKGIPTQNQRFLFTRGFTTTTGSGIGLHHIRNITESMNGSVRFAGNNFDGMGKGACFEVTLQ